MKSWRFDEIRSQTFPLLSRHLILDDASVILSGSVAFVGGNIASSKREIMHWLNRLILAMIMCSLGDVARGDTILAVDFGVRDLANPASPNDVETGFSDFSVAPLRSGSDLRNIGLTTETRTFSGIDVSLSGTANGPTFFDLAPDVSVTNGDLLEDVVRVIQGDIQLVLSNLAAGSYSMQTFHHVSNLSSAPPLFSIDVDNGSGSTTVANGIETTFGYAPGTVSTRTFQFTADGTNDVTILFDGGGPSGNTINPALNGFTLSSMPEPSGVLPLLSCVAFVTTRRQRACPMR